MSLLTQPRPLIIETALTLGRQWCAGHVIDGSPALRHALKVASTVTDHYPEASPDLIAAVILHDAPYFAPENIDLDATLTVELSPDVARIVRAIEREHAALGNGEVPDVASVDRDTLIASAADKLVSIDAITLRAQRADDVAAYWCQRQPFVARVPHFQAFVVAAEPHLPKLLARKLAVVVTRAAESTSPYHRH